MTGPLFRLSFDCPACGKQWGEDARVRRDAACPRCGVVSLYTRARAVDPARKAAEARWHFHDAEDTLDQY